MKLAEVYRNGQRGPQALGSFATLPRQFKAPPPFGLTQCKGALEL